MTDTNRTTAGSQTGCNESLVPLRRESVGFLALVFVESILFATLVAACLIFRFQSPLESWPTTEEMGIPMWLPITGAFALLSSSGTLVLAARSARKKRRSPAIAWSLMTLSLGAGFVTTKILEYRVCGAVGIAPQNSSHLVHDHADLAYLSAVKTSLRSTLDDQSIIGLDRDLPDGLSDLDLIYILQAGLVKWTETVAGRTNDPSVAEMALASVGYQIDQSAFSRKPVEQEILNYLATEREQIALELAKKSQLLKREENELKNTQNTIQRLRSPPVTENTLLDAQLELATQLTATVTNLQSRITDLECRVRFLTLTEPGPNESAQPALLGNALQQSLGLNQRFHLRLPRVIPNGNIWIDTFFLLNSVHLLHIVFGFATLFVVLARGNFATPQMDATRMRHRMGQRDSLPIGSWYWQFLVFVGVVFFALIYIL